MNKKMIKTLQFMSLDNVLFGGGALDGITVNGTDLTGLDTAEGLKILKQNNLIEDGYIIIPKGLEITSTKEYGCTQYNFNNGFLITEIAFDNNNEDEYIA